MNRNYLTILTAAALALATGCVMAGTWVNGTYIDGPLCTVCDGMRIVTHTYGTTVCTHCDGTGIEPPEQTMVVNTVVVDTWCPPPRGYHRRPIVHRPPPRHHPRPIMHGPPPQHHGGGRLPAMRPAHGARPPARGARPPAHRPAGRPAPAGGRGRR